MYTRKLIESGHVPDVSLNNLGHIIFNERLLIQGHTHINEQISRSVDRAS